MKQSPGTQAIKRAFFVLREVARNHEEGISLTMVTRNTELNKATVYRLLLAMKSEGVVDQDPISLRYHLGSQCYTLGRIAENRYGIINLASESVSRLAKVSEDVAFFTVRKEASAICVLRSDGSFPIRSHVLQPGTKTPLGIHAGGLAILAALEDYEVEECLKFNGAAIKQKFPMLVGDKLRALIKTTRDNGYALNPGLVVEGSWGIGVSVCLPNGEVAGALSIAAIEGRMRKERQRELGKRLLKEAKVLESRIGKIETL